MNKFGERLRELRTERGLTQGELAQEFGMARNSIFSYETNKRTPDIDVLVKCAMFFDVTSDYLLGLSDIPKVDAEIQKIGFCDQKVEIARQKLIERIDKALEENTTAERIRWIPVTPETMPPLELLDGLESGDLLLRVVKIDMDGNEYSEVFAGYYQCGEWLTYMDHDYCVLDEQHSTVTHWMSADELLKGVEDNETGNDG